MMRALVPAAALLLIGAAPAGAPQARVASGMLQGEALAGGGAVFKGIPYAAAPVGARRWAPPAPVAPWKGVRAATAMAPACAQPDQGWNHAPAATSSEDCLYLNVWTPKLAANAKLPVMVWIHGGGFSGGSGSDPMFDGQALAARGVILVTVNYRLGVFGFLAHPGLTAESPEKSSGNYGLRDQIAALKWVKANVAAFGGDPANITIFGQSAGGGSVVNLLASPLSKALPRRAIVESGAALRAIRASSLADAEARGQRFAEGKSLADLRGQSTGDLLAAFSKFAQGGPQNGFTPIADGKVLPEDAQAIFAKGGQAHVPLIIGNNSREGLGQIPDAALPGAFKETYGARADAALKLYGLDGGAVPAPDPLFGPVGNQWMTDTTFRCGAVITAGRQAATGSPVWEYQFEASLPGKEAIGAQHSFELPFVFGNLAPDGFLGGAFTPADRALSDTMLGYWTNFAKTGDPNGAGLPAWPRFDAASARYQRLSAAFTTSTQADQGLRREHCALYRATIEN